MLRIIVENYLPKSFLHRIYISTKKKRIIFIIIRQGQTLDFYLGGGKKISTRKNFAQSACIFRGLNPYLLPPKKNLIRLPSECKKRKINSEKKKRSPGKIY